MHVYYRVSISCCQILYNKQLTFFKYFFQRKKQVSIKKRLVNTGENLMLKYVMVRLIYITKNVFALLKEKTTYFKQNLTKAY